MKFRTWNCMIALSLLAALAIPTGMAAQENPSPDHKAKHHKYRLIDIGTLGGPASYTSAGGVGNPILNNNGLVAGYADTPLPDPYYPTCFDRDCYLARAFRWEKGVITDLGALPGTNNSAQSGINERGLVVGFSQNGGFDPLLSVPATRATTWTERGITDLGTLGGYESVAVYVNNGGQVVGLSTNSIPDPYSLFGWGAQIHTFRWQNGAMHDIGTLGGPDAVPGAQCTNQRHDFIAGASYVNNMPNGTTGLPTLDPFLWKNGKMIDLGTLGGTFGVAQCVNNNGQVTGESNLGGDTVSHPFIWTEKTGIQDLGTFGGNNGQATGINDAGDVIGEADFPGDNVHDAFLWRKGVMTDLGNLGATSFAYAINSERQVVGASRIDDTPGNARAFLSERGGAMVDLNTLIPANSSLTLVVAFNINEQGEIAGTGVPAGCQPADVESCGHLYLLMADGGCDGDCQIQVDQGQAEAELRRQNAPAISQRTDSPLSPIDRVRSMMRQRYHLPGQIAAPRE
jgi:probable HAF family extracellular repeat protein